jgi:hypothetical protein
MKRRKEGQSTRQPEPVAPSQHVDLRAHGVERFTTVPKDPGEGDVAEATRRDFALGEADAEFLDAMKLQWATVKEPQGTLLLVIEGWKIPPGYNMSEATLALVVPQGYPDTQVDMAYFSPALTRRDGKAINNLTLVNWTIEVLKEGVYGKDLAEQLTRECLRYLYRLAVPSVETLNRP